MELATDRLLLRDFTPADIPAVMRYQRDPRYLRFYPESWADRSDETIAAFVQMLIDYRAATPRRKFQLAITLPGDDTPIGNVGIRRKDGNEWEADIGYELNPDHWKHGYATEAARAVVAFGFRELGLHRISAWCIADNLASVAVLERTGLRVEGRLREEGHFRGRWWDTLIWGLLESEWRASSGRR
jgi:RimJ/RimL family protein N-acetyltransferase